MDKKLFKGFKQVSSVQFNAAKEAGTLDGYLWFVRTEVPDGGDNNVANDEYSIYFGKKQYGHFCDGEISALKDALNAVREDLGFAPGEFNFGEGVETIQDAFNSIAEMLNALTSATESNKSAHEANAASITSIQNALAEHLVKNVDENDKVLNVADGILSSSISLTYVNNRISLVGKDDKEIAGFDASEFIKDSVLDDVKVETKEDGEKYIIFTWKTEGDEAAKTDEIKVSDFAKLYNAGTALELAEDGVTFNVKVAANNNFLSVNDNNELIVDDVTSDKTLIKESITIKGGPLATDGVIGAFEGGVIPAGTDIQAVLKALLCVEIYPETSKTTPEYSISISAPTIKATGLSNKALVEIGQTISFSAVTATSVSVSKTEPVVSGFENGYSATIDGDIIESNTASGAWTIGQKENTVYTLTASKTNFEGTVPTAVSAATASECSLAAVSFTAVAGDNTYTVTESAPTYTGTYTGVDSKYIVSNLGGRSEEKKSVSISAQTTAVEDDADNKSASFTVTGVYPVYTNGVTASTTDATAAAMADLASPVSGDGTKLALMKASTSFAVSFAAQGAEPYRLFLPGSWKISTASAIDGFTSKYAINCKSDFKANGTTTRKVQGTDVTYTIYEWAGKEGANRVKFTVG